MHAAPVSVGATERAIERLPQPFAARHALVTNLVDPNATSFVEDDAAYRKLERAVAAHRKGDEARVVLSCSVYNGFAQRLQADIGIPVERSDDAVLRAAVAYGRRIALAVSYPPSYAVIETHLRAVAAESGRPVAPVPLLAENAFAFAGDPVRYAAALEDAAARANDVDCVVLAQFSMDPYATQVAGRTEIPVLSALRACLERLASPSV